MSNVKEVSDAQYIKNIGLIGFAGVALTVATGTVVQLSMGLPSLSMTTTMHQGTEVFGLLDWSLVGGFAASLVWFAQQMHKEFSPLKNFEQSTLPKDGAHLPQAHHTEAPPQTAWVAASIEELSTRLELSRKKSANLASATSVKVSPLIKIN